MGTGEPAADTGSGGAPAPYAGGPLQVGLTGSIGAGKSTVAGMLAELGAAVVDADLLAREATRDPAVLDAIEREVGPGLVVSDDGVRSLDRAATAALVFADEAALRRLNAVIHPWVRRRAREIASALARRSPPPQLIVHDVPLLYESGLEDEYVVVVVVDAPSDARARRLAARSGLGPEEVARREAAQLPAARKVARADHVVVNAGDTEDLRAAVRSLWLALTAGAAHQSTNE